MSEVYILGLDPGFASFGFGVVQLFPDHEKIIHVDVIRTEKSTKKQNVLSVDDNFRRARAISVVIRHQVKIYRPAAMTAESLSLPRNSSSASKVSMSWGILACIVEAWQIPMMQVTPQGLKKKVCGFKTASKEDVRHAMEERYPGQFDAFKKKFKPKKPPKPNGQWEHGFDAVASVVSCLDSEVIRMARGLACRGV